MKNYINYLEKLFHLNLFNGIKLGLENSKRLDVALNHPATAYKTVHVAGTNGKGSVSTKIAKGLELSNFKTGLFTSPHISTFRERIQINGKLISESEVTALLEILFEIKDSHEIPATFFEMTTFLALQFFKNKKVDFAVLEAGLGGRLDATNIITPILTIITSISFDHTDILGNTLEKITLEKAGIIKPFVPILIGPKVDRQLIEKIAQENKSPFFQVEGDFSTYEEENNAIAKSALELLKVKTSPITEALQIKPPCRFQEIIRNEKTIILDVAHNPDGLRVLFSEVRTKYPNKKIRLIFGISANKEISNCLSLLKKEGDYFHLVAATNGRGLKIKELKKLLEAKEEIEERKKDIFTHESVKEALDVALTSEFKSDELIVICGTFFIMAEALKALGLESEEADLIEVNEK